MRIAHLPDRRPVTAVASPTLTLRQATDGDVAYLAALAADPHVEPFLAFAAADEDRLVALEVENYYLKWLDARQRAESLRATRTKAIDLGNRVFKRFDDGQASGNADGCLAGRG